MAATSLLYTALIELDVLIFIITSLAAGYVSLVLSAHQTIQPFFPQDAALWYVFTTDTIHTGFVFFVHYVLLAPAIFLCERFILTCTTSLPAQRKTLTAARLALGLLSATMIAVLFVEVGKGYVGRLRPSFASACLAGEDPQVAIRANLPPVLSDKGCSGPSKLLHDARRSFPSGHAALGVGGAAYAQLYAVYAARRWPGSKAQRLVVYATGWAAMMFGAWVAASRIVDNAHHVSDVAVGSLLGVWAAIVHFWFVVGEVADAAGTEEKARLEEKVRVEEKEAKEE